MNSKKPGNDQSRPIFFLQDHGFEHRREFLPELSRQTQSEPVIHDRTRAVRSDILVRVFQIHQPRHLVLQFPYDNSEKIDGVMAILERRIANDERFSSVKVQKEGVNISLSAAEGLDLWKFYDTHVSYAACHCGIQCQKIL